jgi:hypothetical protein
MDTVQISMSPTVGKIAEAMAKAQLTMRPAVKDATNPHFKNRYASLVSCLEAVRPLNENGIAVFQPPASRGPDGVCVATLLVHSSGEWIRGELYMPAAKKDPQGFGSALSYARRYCLVSTVGIAADDDDDAETAVRVPEKAPAPKASEPSETEQTIASMFMGARTADDVAAAEAAAARAIAQKHVVNGGRERLLKLRTDAIARLEGR